MKLAVALNFNNVFPDEKELDVLDYLKRIPKKLLLEFIGFCNTNPLPNYYNFFSKPEVSENIITFSQDEIKSIKKDVYYRIIDFIKKHPILAFLGSALLAVILGIIGSLVASSIWELLLKNIFK